MRHGEEALGEIPEIFLSLWRPRRLPEGVAAELTTLRVVSALLKAYRRSVDIIACRGGVLNLGTYVDVKKMSQGKSSETFSPQIAALILRSLLNSWSLPDPIAFSIMKRAIYRPTALQHWGHSPRVRSSFALRRAFAAVNDNSRCATVQCLLVF